MTSAGFGPRRPDPGGLSKLSVLRCDHPRALAWVTLDDRVLVGANGAVVEFFDHLEQTIELFERLRRGEDVGAREILRLAAPYHREQVRGFLRESGLARTAR